MITVYSIDQMRASVDCNTAVDQNILHPVRIGLQTLLHPESARQKLIGLYWF